MKHWIATAALALAATTVAAQSTEAEVRKVDAAQGKLTLKHGEIKHLDMPPMTMVFRVSDPKLLDGLAVGDKLRVDIARVDGQYTVTALRKAD
jgi:Cu/Ag efflux protein CusF